MSVRRNIKMLQCSESKVWLAVLRYFDGVRAVASTCHLVPRPLLCIGRVPVSAPVITGRWRFIWEYPTLPWVWLGLWPTPVEDFGLMTCSLMALWPVLQHMTIASPASGDQPRRVLMSSLLLIRTPRGSGVHRGAARSARTLGSSGRQIGLPPG